MTASSRDRMIDSAITLFRERGVAATSLRDVVEHSGAPRGSIYHHFPGGKAELATAATVKAGEFISGLLDPAVDPGDLVAGFAGYWSSALAKSQFTRGCPVAAGALSDEPAARAAAGHAFAAWQRAIAGALEARGTAADRAAALATLAVSAIEGALVIARAQASTTPLETVTRELRSLLEVD